MLALLLCFAFLNLLWFSLTCGRIWKKRQIIYIMRGLPGSGKTTYMNNMICHNLNTNSFESISFKDYYDGNPRDIPKAYTKCFTKFMNEVYLGTQHIFIDNPHIERWEYENYIVYGKMNGYKIVIIELGCPSTRYLECYHSLTNTSISLDTMYSQYERWEEDPLGIKVPSFVQLGQEDCGDSLPFPSLSKDILDKQLDSIVENRRLYFERKKNE